MHFNSSLLALMMAALLAGCAGPTTPLGAPWATSSADTRNGPLSFITSLFDRHKSEIRFTPARQNLHGPGPLTIVVRDPAGIRSNYKLVVRHNGLDVTPSFLRQADVSIEADELRIHVPLVRLPADNENLIEVVYGATSSGAGALTAYARYEPPTCQAFSPHEIVSTDSFSPSRELVELIRKLSTARRFNPAFTAGLIAQESGFESRRVSWAKAIGLTQVTPPAEDEIAAEYTDWPRYPGLNDLPALFVKALVLSGHANSRNEWRLDSRRSIDGGLTYLEMLSERWSEPQMAARVRATFPDPDVASTRLILASYNSGFTRVASAFARLGPNWLSAPELREARKYVNRIMSYCDHFSEKPDSNGETI